MVHTIPVGFIPLADAFAQAVSELADFTQSALDERGSDTEHDYFNRRDKIVRQIEKSMRNALADRDLSVFIDTPDGFLILRMCHIISQAPDRTVTATQPFLRLAISKTG